MKDVFYIICLFLASAVHSNAYQINNSYTDQIAAELYESRDFDSSIVVLDEFLSTFDSSSERDNYRYSSLLNLLGNSYLNAYMTAEADSCFLLVLNNSSNVNIKLEATIGRATVSLNSYGLTKLKVFVEQIEAELKINQSLYREHYAVNQLFKGALFYFSDELEKSKVSIRNVINHPATKSKDLFKAYHWMNEIFLKEKNFDSSEYFVEKRFELVHTKFNSDLMMLADCNSSRSWLEHLKGNTHKTIEILEQNILPVLKANKFSAHYRRATAYQELSYYYGKLANYQRALEYAIKDLNLKEQQFPNNQTEIASTYRNIAQKYDNLELIDKAIDYVEKAIDLYLIEKNIFGLTRAYKAYAIYLQKSGQLKKSLKVMEELRPLISSIDYYFYLAFINYYSGDYPQAQEAIEIAFKDYNEQLYRDTNKLTNMLTWSGRLLLDKGDAYAAKLKLEESLYYCKSTNSVNNFNLVYTHNLYARSLIELEKLNEADSILKKAVQINTKFPIKSGNQDHDNYTSIINKFNRIHSYAYEGQLNKKRYELTRDLSWLHEAMVIYNKGIDLIFERERRTGASVQTDKLFLKSLYDDIFSEAIETLFELYNVTKESDWLIMAFQLVEKSKAPVLVEGLNTKVALKFGNIPDSIRVKEASLKNQITYLQSQIFQLEQKESQSVKIAAFRDELISSKQQYEDFTKRLNTSYPQYHELKYNAKTLSIQELQRNLDENELVLSYKVTNNHTYIFAISKDTKRGFTAPVLPDSLVTRLRESLIPNTVKTNPVKAYKTYTSSAYRLYENYVSIALEGIDSYNTLKILPDGPFSYLPFELLLTSSSSDKNSLYKDLPYLIKVANISYAYSATSLFTQSKHSGNGKGVLGIAPNYESNYTDTLKFPKTLTPLKWNENEVSVISDYYEGTELIRERATELYFKKHIGQYNIAHLAMHALVDDSNPMYSKLVFTPGSDSIEDGSLHAFELYDMNLDIEMVALSACNTGYGRYHKGEGVMSLARAFAYAGCPSVLMSHWKVEDKTTSILMAYYYDYLAQGNRKDEALRLAKLDFIEKENPFYGHPYFWNGFVVLGDTRPISSSNNSHWWMVIFTFSTVLAFLFFKIGRSKSLF